MKKRVLLYSIFGLVFYLLFLIIEMPASWLAWGVNRYSSGIVRLDPISGSLWQGSGRLVVYYPQTVPHDFGNAEWRINPLWLFTGRVQVSLENNTQDAKVKTTLSVGKEKITLKNTDATFPAASISSFYPQVTLIGPQGQVKFHTSKFVLGQQNVEGDATLEWLGAISSFSSIQPLGDYRLDIAGAGSAANLKLTTLRGALELTGQGQWQPANGRFLLTGSAVPRDRAAELKSLLDLFGSDQGAGRRTWALNTSFPALH